MKDRYLVFSQKPVKLPDYTVKIMDNIISAVVGVTGIKADPKLVRVSDAVINACQFLEGTAVLRASAGHFLKGY